MLSSVPATSTTKARIGASLGALEAVVRGRRGSKLGCAIHSLAHARVHPFTRLLVVALLAAPPVPAYTCAMRPGHAFCYMMPV